MIPSSVETAPRPLIVNLARYFGGAEIRVIELAEAFAPHGGRVACLAGSPLAQRLQEMDLQPVTLPEDKSDPRLAWSLGQAIREGGYTLVDAHNVQSYFWTLAALAGRPNRPAMAATVHSSPRMEHRNLVKQYGYESLERLCLPRFDQVITVSQFLQAEIRRWGIPSERISVSPNGVMLQRAGLQAGEAARSELGLQPGDLVIGSVGRLEPAKGYHFLLEALARLSPRWPRLRCILVGDGRLMPDLQALAAGLGLARQVIFTGFRKDVMRLMEAFDIFVLPSLTEGIPFALLEASASARPIVASCVGGVPEVIHDRLSGWLTPPGDVPHLASAIEALLRDPDAAERMGRQAAQNVERDFSMARMLDAACNAYSTALRRRAPRRR